MTFEPRVTIPSLSGPYLINLRGRGDWDWLLSAYDPADTLLIETLATAWVGLLGDSPCDVKPRGTLNRFVRDLLTDLWGTVRRYSLLADTLVQQLERGEDGSIIVPPLVGIQKTPVLREYQEFQRTGDPRILRFLLSFLWFGKKASPSSTIDLELASLRDWLEIEQELGTLQLEPQRVKNLRHVLAWLLGSYRFDGFFPAHGGGAVAEVDVRGVGSKNASFRVTRKVAQYLRAPYYCDAPMEFGAPVPDSSLKHPEECPEETEVARLKFVPKTFKAVRSICMEPVEKQWLQQGVRITLEKYFREHPIIRNHVVLEDQSFNRTEAKAGSRDGRSDTIDLSSASDRLALQLVKLAFPAHVRKHLIATRSGAVRVPRADFTVEVKKFAPMGSALCFPTQTLVYLACALLAGISQAHCMAIDDPSFTALDLDQAYKYSFGSRFNARDRFVGPRIYGDDITCDKRVTSNLIALLESLGFKVNQAKSFRGEQAFRESCGGFFALGKDVTPVLYRIKGFKKGCLTPEGVGSVVDLANRLGDYGYFNARKVVVNLALRVPLTNLAVRENQLNPILFCEWDDVDSSFAIRSPNPVNRHLHKRRYGEYPGSQTSAEWYQRDETLSVGLQPCEYVPYIDETYRHVAWWRARYISAGAGSEAGGDAVDAFGTRFSWRWTPS